MAGLSLVSVPGIRVGHWTHLEAGTGCTVVLCENAVAVGVDVRGGAPATRETDLLRPGSLIGRAQAILLSGGSAFGLDAATGVMRYLEERGVGVPTRGANVPIVSAAALYDLAFGRSDIRPDAAAGYAACQAASADPIAEGTLGAGTGATVAKQRGGDGAIKGGIGTAGRVLSNGLVVAALVAVNAVGSVFEPWTGEAVAVPREAARGHVSELVGANTTIGVIATNARLDGSMVNRLAMLGHNGLALSIRPAHTLYDGDTLFAISLPGSTPEVEVEPSRIDYLELFDAASAVVAEAIVRGVRAATSLHGVPAVTRA
jgi:L-aminopeptidase/D-esterase-like protein